MTKAKSITFRCSETQHRRMEGLLAQTGNTRTAFICEALELFLDFADEHRHLNLFELVEAVNNVGSRHRFEDEA